MANKQFGNSCGGALHRLVQLACRDDHRQIQPGRGEDERQLVGISQHGHLPAAGPGVGARMILAEVSPNYWPNSRSMILAPNSEGVFPDSPSISDFPK